MVVATFVLVALSAVIATYAVVRTRLRAARRIGHPEQAIARVAAGLADTPATVVVITVPDGQRDTYAEAVVAASARNPVSGAVVVAEREMDRSPRVVRAG